MWNDSVNFFSSQQQCLVVTAHARSARLSPSLSLSLTFTITLSHTLVIVFFFCGGQSRGSGSKEMERVEACATAAVEMGLMRWSLRSLLCSTLTSSRKRVRKVSPKLHFPVRNKCDEKPSNIFKYFVEQTLRINRLNGQSLFPTDDVTVLISPSIILTIEYRKCMYNSQKATNQQFDTVGSTHSWCVWTAVPHVRVSSGPACAAVAAGSCIFLHLASSTLICCKCRWTILGGPNTV